MRIEKTVNVTIFDWLWREQDNSRSKSKKVTQIWKKMFSKILTIFFTGYLGEIDAINEVMVIITWLLKHAENSRL